jgi:hypothetical protein
MTDEQREKSIDDLSLLIDGATQRWEKNGCLHAKGQAYYYRSHIQRLINERIPVHTTMTAEIY